MNKDKMPEVGEAVIYCNPVGQDHNAIITAVWGVTCCNVVFVSGDPTKTDTYGRQIERQTSLQRVGPNTTYGQYFRYADDEKIAVTAPVGT